MIEATFGRISKYTGKHLNVPSAVFIKKFNSIEELVKFRVNCRYAALLFYTGYLNKVARHIVRDKTVAMIEKRNKVTN